MIELKCDTCGKVIGYVDEVGGYADFAYQVWYCLEHGYKVKLEPMNFKAEFK